MPEPTAVHRPGVTPDRIISVAGALADQHGLEHLTMASIARELGISVPGLYKHVSSLAEVRRAIAFHGISGLTGGITAETIGRSGRDAVISAAGAYRAYARRHPGCYAASIVAPPADDPAYTEISDQAVRTILAIFSAWSLDEATGIDAVRAFRTILHGFVSLEAAGGFGLPQSIDATFGRLIDGFTGMLDRWEDMGPGET